MLLEIFAYSCNGHVLYGPELDLHNCVLIVSFYLIIPYGDIFTMANIFYLFFTMANIFYLLIFRKIDLENFS